MTWRGELHLHYRLEDGRIRALDRHSGPLRVLKAHPGAHPAACEHVLVHPPGGLAGGDELDVWIEQEAGTEVRITTPGATRFYRSLGAVARQSVSIQLGADAVLEWLPLETIAHGGCLAQNLVRARLAPGALMLGWDVSCLGLPASGDRFDQGRFEQHLEIEGAWIERGLIEAQDARLRESPLGLAGRPVWATMWCAAGHELAEPQRQALVQAACGGAGDTALRMIAGATSPNPRVVALRLLADRVEPMWAVLRSVRQAWRNALGLPPADEPRIWRL